MIQENAIILDKKQLSPSFFKLAIQSKYISENSLPGQFIELRVSTEQAPLLRRPFSIHNTDKTNNSIEVLFEVLGDGTQLLSKRKQGEAINVLGPLGTGFNIKSSNTAILIGGGMGVAPLFFLAKEVVAICKSVIVLIGAKTKEQVMCEDDLKKLGAQVFVSTDDGSYGQKGLVTDLINIQPSIIYACGPQPMLKSVASLAAKNNIYCQVSLEAFMACGIGACKGCAIKSTSGYKMVCKDGPVFSSKEIIWE